MGYALRGAIPIRSKSRRVHPPAKACSREPAASRRHCASGTATPHSKAGTCSQTAQRKPRLSRCKLPGQDHGVAAARPRCTRRRTTPKRLGLVRKTGTTSFRAHPQDDLNLFGGSTLIRLGGSIPRAQSRARDADFEAPPQILSMVTGRRAEPLLGRNFDDGRAQNSPRLFVLDEHHDPKVFFLPV